MTAGGPLAGVRVVELAGLGPAPFCGMLLSDLGAEVVLVDRPGTPPRDPTALLYRGRRGVTLDLKQPAERDACLDLIAGADLLIEGFRPGVMERLGLGPAEAQARNPALVYGRMTGWGQQGPYAAMAGHDINYVAISGALHAIGPAERPIPPLNLLGDFGGGALYLAVGLLAALHHARASGVGQVVDCAICDGAASLMAMQYGYLAAGRWTDRREANRLDGGAPHYGTFRCADGEWIALGSLEPQFYADLVARLDLDAAGDLPDRDDPRQWPALRARIAERIATRTRAQWCDALIGSDVCFAPILSMADAPHDPHNQARGTFVAIDGVTQPAPAPRFDRTPGAIRGGTVETAADVLADWRRA